MDRFDRIFALHKILSTRRTPISREELQQRLGKSYLELWGAASKRLAGEQAEPAIAPSPRDKRFASPEWKANAFYDFLMQAYLLTTQWADELVKNAEIDRFQSEVTEWEQREYFEMF